jgi:hypothetical protein
MIVSVSESRLLPGATTIDSPARIRREPEAPRTIVPFVDFRSGGRHEPHPLEPQLEWVPDHDWRAATGPSRAAGAPPAALGMRGASGRRPMRTGHDADAAGHRRSGHAGIPGPASGAAAEPRHRRHPARAAADQRVHGVHVDRHGSAWAIRRGRGRRSDAAA